MEQRKGVNAKTSKSWPLACPECGDRIVLELPPKLEAGHTGTAACGRRHHPFIFQYDGRVVEVVGARHVRGRHRG